MTDPTSRTARQIRAFAWIYLTAGVVGLVGGIVVLALGSTVGWGNIGLSIIFFVQSVYAFRTYRRRLRDEEHADGLDRE